MGLENEFNRQKRMLPYESALFMLASTKGLQDKVLSSNGEHIFGKDMCYFFLDHPDLLTQENLEYCKNRNFHSLHPKEAEAFGLFPKDKQGIILLDWLNKHENTPTAGTIEMFEQIPLNNRDMQSYAETKLLAHRQEKAVEELSKRVNATPANHLLRGPSNCALPGTDQATLDVTSDVLSINQLNDVPVAHEGFRVVIIDSDRSRGIEYPDHVQVIYQNIQEHDGQNTASCVDNALCTALKTRQLGYRNAVYNIDNHLVTVLYLPENDNLESLLNEIENTEITDNPLQWELYKEIITTSNDEASYSSTWDYITGVKAALDMISSGSRLAGEHILDAIKTLQAVVSQSSYGHFDIQDALEYFQALLLMLDIAALEPFDATGTVSFFPHRRNPHDDEPGGNGSGDNAPDNRNNNIGNFDDNSTVAGNDNGSVIIW